MRTLQWAGLWVCGGLLAMAPAVVTGQMGQAPPCATAGCSSDPTLGMPSGASTGRGSRGQQLPQQPGPMGPDPSQMDPKLEHDQAKLRNVDRQKQLVADTQKLVSLANELQSDVQKSSKDTLSLDVIRKADEIEKLAKSVRDKMKGS